MSEYLTVRISRNNGPILWAVWSSLEQRVLERGELVPNDLSQLTPLAHNRSTILLLCASEIVLRDVTVPLGASSRQLEQILPYLLEDDIAQDVDDLHFSLLAKQGNTAFIAALAKSRLTELIDRFRQHGMEVIKVLPDALALPDTDGISVASLSGQWMIKRGQWFATSVAESWLPLVLNSDWLWGQQPNRDLYSYSVLPDALFDDSMLDPVITRHLQPPCDSFELLAKQSVTSKMTLLTGTFRRHSSWVKPWLVWRKVAFALVVLVLVSLLTQWFSIYRTEQQAQAYRQESERIFHTIFPNKQKIPTSSYLKREIDGEAARMSGGVSQSSVLKVLEILTQSWQGTREMSIQKMRFDDQRGELRIDVQGREFQSFDTLREQLEAHFVVELGQLTRSGNDVFGSYTLKQK